MITASHNPECDNGAKLIDPCGEMLDQAWEVYANDLSTLDDDVIVLSDYLATFMTELNIAVREQATVAIAYDTR